MENSNCCDAPMNTGICSACKESCISHGKQMELDRREAEKELFQTVYQWGRVGIVTDEHCATFQKLLYAVRI